MSSDELAFVFDLAVVMCLALGLSAVFIAVRRARGQRRRWIVAAIVLSVLFASRIAAMQFSNVESAMLFPLSAVVFAIAGLVLLGWALLWDRARGRRRCPQCWYDMSRRPAEHDADRRCPECGHVARSEKRLFRTRRRGRWALASLLIFVLALLAAIQPKVRRDGWASLVPNTALVLSLRLSNNTWAFDKLDERTTVDISAIDPTAAGYDVFHAGTLYAWQWEMISNACVDLMERDLGRQEKFLIIEWMERCLDGVSEKRAHELHRTMATFLTDPDPAVRAHAAIYCASSRSPLFAVQIIAPLTADPDRRVRTAAVSGLRLLARKSQEPLAALAEALKHEDWEVRMFAAAALGTMAEFADAPDSAFEMLRERYDNDPKIEVTCRALMAMAKFSRHQDTVRELAISAVGHSEPRVRDYAFRVLVDLEGGDANVLLELTLQGLRDESKEVRESAAELLRDRIPTEVLRPHREFLQTLADENNIYIQGIVLPHLHRMNGTPEN